MVKKIKKIPITKLERANGIVQVGACSLGEFNHISQHPDARHAMAAMLTNKNTHLWDVQKKAYTYKYTYRDPYVAHVIFSCVVKLEGSEQDYGQKFADLIRKEKLGPVVASKVDRMNPNHQGHLCRAWIWSPRRDKLKAWYAANVDITGVNLVDEPAKPLAGIPPEPQP